MQGQDNKERNTAMSELDNKKKYELDSGERVEKGAREMLLTHREGQKAFCEQVTFELKTGEEQATWSLERRATQEEGTTMQGH